MKIRPYQSNDQEAVVSLWQDCQLTVPWNDPIKDIVRKLSIDPDWFLVGETDGEIIGSMMVGYDGHRGWINYLAVSPDYRRQGFGEKFMDRAEQLLLDKGCPKLNLQIRAGNHEILEFYKKLGYVEDHAVSLGKRLIADT